MQDSYYTPPNPAAYTAVDKLVRETKAPRNEVTRWLKHQDAYSMHKPVRKRFQRRSYNVKNIDDA